jgi:hypothetical protein
MRPNEKGGHVRNHAHEQAMEADSEIFYTGAALPLYLRAALCLLFTCTPPDGCQPVTVSFPVYPRSTRHVRAHMNIRIRIRIHMHIHMHIHLHLHLHLHIHIHIQTLDFHVP